MHSLPMAPVMEVVQSAWRGVSRRMGQILTRGRTLVWGSKKTEPTSLSLGEDKDGRAWVLNLATGEVEMAPAVQPTSTVQPTGATLQLHELTPKLLHSVFDNAGYGVKPLEANIICIDTEIGVVQVGVNPRGMLLGFRRQFSRTSWDPQDAKRQAKLIEKINGRTILVRFRIDREDGEITAEYALPLLAGVTRPQILAALRAFVMSVRTHAYGTPGLEIT